MKQRNRHGYAGTFRAVIFLAFSIAFFSSLAVSCGGNAPKVLSELRHSDTYVAFKIKSASIAKGSLEKKAETEIHVTLPDSYAVSPDRRYPVIYGLHGFGDSAMGMITPFDRALKAAGASEVILVGVDGTNSLGGSFYANSPATGYWEDLVVKEAVALIDKKFRTLARPEGRMLSGFSMGGFGAWNLALKHPDVFSYAWVCCPGAWDRNGLKNTLDVWGTTYRNAYGAAFSPDFSLPAPHARVPSLDGTYGDALVKADWETGFGGIDAKLQAYSAGTARLRSVRFAYGSRDDYSWIPRGTRFVAEAMREAGIPVEIREFTAAHRITTDMLAESFVPFVQAHLIVDNKNK